MWTNLKQAIDSVIRTNDNQEITGAILNNTLKTIVDTVGANATYAGIATPSTNPGTPDGPVFYFAAEAGTYVNFGAAVIQEGLAVLLWDGTSWSSESVFNKEAMREVFDISAANSGATYADLADALGTNGANVPSAIRKGGMSVKFVLTSDNKYVQYRLMADTWSVDTNDWSFCGDDVIVENPEWIRVITDKDGKILTGIKTDGDVYFGAGVPNQINHVLSTKEDKEEGKKLIDSTFSDGISYFDYTDFFYAILDANKKILFSIDKTGDCEFGNGVPQQVKEFIKNSTPKTPFYDFKIEQSLRDISEYYNLFDVATQESRRNTPWQLWDLFDALTLNNESMLTKYDPMASEATPSTSGSPEILPLVNIKNKMTDVGWGEYPFYCNGIEEAETREFTYPNGYTETFNYYPCPAYKTYIYRLNYKTSVGAEKIPILLTGNLHGNELVSPYMLYMLADSIVNCKDVNLYSLGMIFDIYIIPSINSYGSKNGTRQNANGVDINRNFPYAWKFDDSDPVRYSGPYAGSEFETELLMAIISEIKPSLIIDAHTYGFTAYQYYAEFQDLNIMPSIYQAHNDVCATLIKDMPEYFGTKLQSFGSRDLFSLGSLKGRLLSWYQSEGLGTGATLEVSQNINFSNGEHRETGAGFFSEDVFQIADYTYRAGLYPICKYLLSYKH